MVSVAEGSVIAKLKSKSLSKCEKEWTIEILKEAVEAEQNRFFSRVEARAEVPGFRRGKAPRHVLERYYKEQAREEIVKTLLAQSVREAMLKEKENLLHLPTVNDIQFADTALSFKVHLELRPQIKLGRYQHLNVKCVTLDVTEEDITKVVDRMRERSTIFEVVNGRSVEIGDYIVVDFSLKIDGKQIEQKTSEMFQVIQDDFLPGFAEQAVGLHIGQSRDISTHFPKNTSKTEWADKPAIFSVTLKEIKKKRLPEPNDDWISSMSQLKSYSELRENIRQDILRMKEREAEQSFEESIMDALVKQTKFDVPENTISRRYHRLHHDRIDHLMRLGYAEEKAEKTAAEQKDNIRKEAERQVRIGLILDEIAREENVSVTEDEIARKIDGIVEQTGQPREKIEEAYRDEDGRGLLREQVKYEKVILFLKNSAKGN